MKNINKHVEIFKKHAKNNVKIHVSYISCQKNYKFIGISICHVKKPINS